MRVTVITKAILVGIVAVLMTSCTGPAAPVLSPVMVTSPITAQIKLYPDSSGRLIPSDFVGLSFDTTTLSSKHFDTGNDELINLMNNLGKGILCYGAKGVEYSYWPRTTIDQLLYRLPFSNVRALLTPSDIDRMFAFANKIGWRVIFGLNLRANNPEMAADVAAYAAKAGGDSIAAFQVGNEPDLYSRDGLRGPDYTYTDFLQEFRAYTQSLRKRVPDLPIAGPGTATNINWFTGFLRDEAKNLTIATNHLYPLNADPNLDPLDPRYASIENLLGAATTKRTDDLVRRFADIATVNNISVRFDETNSSYPGKTGLGDTLAAALWGLDYQFDLAERGVAGANFFCQFDYKGLTPVWQDRFSHYHAQPIYYGLLLFHLAAKGRIVPVELVTTANMTTHATLDSDGALRLVIINKDLYQPVNAVIATGKQYRQAGVVRLTAPAIDATEGITLAGSVVKADGTWSPKTEEQILLEREMCRVLVPAGSAALISFR